ncbi:hypothetical protein GN956_G5209 [Arapaima gigas]
MIQPVLAPAELWTTGASPEKTQRSRVPFLVPPSCRHGIGLSRARSCVRLGGGGRQQQSAGRDLPIVDVKQCVAELQLTHPCATTTSWTGPREKPGAG